MYSDRDDYYRSGLAISPQESHLEIMAEEATTITSIEPAENLRANIIYLNKGPMNYKRFERLMNLLSRFGRILHTSPNKKSIRKSVTELESILYNCPLYNQFIRQYANTVKQVG